MLKIVALLFTGKKALLKRVGASSTLTTLLLGNDQSNDAAACMNETVKCPMFLLTDAHFYPFFVLFFFTNQYHLAVTLT